VSVIALIPARSGSKGIPGKNFRQLGGKTLVQHAVDCARAAGIDRICVSTDLQSITADDVGADVLLQPTAVFRTPARVREAIQLLQSTGADSVVSVVPLPLTHHADAQLAIGSILGPDRLFGVGEYPEFPDSCLNRQQREQTYIRDGTVYAFKRDTVARYGHIYGDYCKPLILEPHETCELDTEADWAAVQARWEREHA
jgi:CMP-N,N'-diacetyllegionaminic acid synthase